jgi:hypothetical protein
MLKLPGDRSRVDAVSPFVPSRCRVRRSATMSRGPVTIDLDA